MEDVMGYVHSVETGGTVDGPGLRYIIFLSGCPLRCQYCHNPDTMKMKRGKMTSAYELLKDIATYRSYFEQGGGGITVSGGEPLAQIEFLRVLLWGAKQMGIHTTIDTSGYLGKKADDELIDLIDLFLLDVKSWVPETYKNVTGVEIAPTLEFAKRLQKMGKEVWGRFVLVPGLTDAPENVEGVAKFVGSLDNVSRMDVLPFHKMGEHKWQQMGMSYQLNNTEPPTPESLAHVQQVFKDQGLNVH
ncbi:pyruvate formate-lyase-activating protein [Polycladidibacter stylochi]|uniref:pyruvate formate-lyase-activating protein n=1 Tax=Polycladidibacter stylochi TaxID=1807766 RepID=UPI0008313192|nr:pyruvate formate-lyase-activating protein [Pseudovibrio stylochi]